MFYVQVILENWTHQIVLDENDIILFMKNKTYRTKPH